MLYVILLTFICGFTGHLFAQTLTQQQMQGAQDKINADISQISQIEQDESTLSAQYQQSLQGKDNQIASLQKEIYLLNSWVASINNAVTNTETTTNTDTSTDVSVNLDVQGTATVL